MKQKEKVTDSKGRSKVGAIFFWDSESWKQPIIITAESEVHCRLAYFIGKAVIGHALDTFNTHQSCLHFKSFFL